LARLGVEKELFAVGARVGDEVVIGDGPQGVVFDWEPTMSTGAELLGGPRGSDTRLEESERPTRAEKRAEFHARKDAQAAARAELQAEREDESSCPRSCTSAPRLRTRAGRTAS